MVAPIDLGLLDVVPFFLHSDSVALEWTEQGFPNTVK